jgi:hypothetical protein
MTRPGLRVKKLDANVQELRVQAQTEARQQSGKKNPLSVLGSPSKRIEVGQYPNIPKDLLQR